MPRFLGHLGNNDLLLRARSFLFKKASELGRYCMLGKLQSNLDYPDSLGPDEMVRIIEGPDNRKYEY